MCTRRGIITTEAESHALDGIRMHFDGKVFIPEEPVDMPLNEPLDFEYKPPEPKLSAEEIARRLEASCAA